MFRSAIQRVLKKPSLRKCHDFRRASSWSTSWGTKKSRNWRLLPAVAASVIVVSGGAVFVWSYAQSRLYEVHSAEEKKREQIKKFEGKTVLITGAAGDLGSTTARAFSRQGARLVLCDLPSTETKLEQLSTELLTLGSPAVICASVDVTNIEDVKRCVQQSVEQFGGIDVLFNNAGIFGTASSVEQTDEAMFKKIQDVNVYGVFLMMKHVSEEMIKSGRGGVIINMSSIAGLQGSKLLFAYSASKFAVSGMTRAAAKSLAMHKIRVCALAPYFLEGSLADGILEDASETGQLILLMNCCLN